MDIYTLLNEIIDDTGYKSINGNFSAEERERLDSKNEEYIFDLIKNICSLAVKYEGENIYFLPQLVLEGKRTFGIQDVKDEDYDILESLDISKLSPVLAVRIAEMLWIQRHDYKKALIAIDNYIYLFESRFDSERQNRCLEVIKRAVVLLTKLNRKQDLNKVLTLIYDKIVELDGNDRFFLSINFIKILYENKWTDKKALIDRLDIVIDKTEDIRKVEKAYQLKIKIYKKLNDDVNCKKSKIELAKKFVDEAKRIENENIQGLFGAEKCLKQAVFNYRDAGEFVEAENVHRYLITLERKIPQYMIPIVLSEKDIEKSYELVDDIFADLSLEEHILLITLCTCFFKQEDIKKWVYEKSDPINRLWGMENKNEYGQTMIEIDSLGLNNIDSKNLEVHMHSELKFREDIVGKVHLKRALYLLNNNFKYNKEDLRFLVNDNPIIPYGRENIFLSAIYYGLQGDIYLSLHILAPQMENLFRKIAENAGAIISTLKADRSSENKVLSSVFTLPELIDCYDNDILFLFQGLMNEKAGANIRNEIAHGIMGEVKGSSGCSIFFLCAVLKLLSLTSKRAYEILRESEALNSKKIEMSC